MISFKGGGGASKKEAVIIAGTEDTVEGVGAEYYFIDKIREVSGQDVQLVKQSLIHDRKKHYDLMLLRFEDGEEVELWFDITGFYGKFNH